MHDWMRVTAGTFHDFHLAWIAELRRALNGGLLPSTYYAMAEQVTGRPVPDVLTLQDISGPLADEGFDIGRSSDAPEFDAGDGGGGRAVALADAPPRVSSVESIPEETILTLARRRIVIRHATNDRIVALIEIVSRGNKAGRGAVQAFVDKVVAALQQGYHVLLLDAFPPRASDPQGIHDRVWREMEGGGFEPPAGRPLTLVSYRAASGITAYVEPVAVGQTLPDMPLFLDADHYVNVPLEATYTAAYEGVPRRWRRVIEAPTP